MRLGNYSTRAHSTHLIECTQLQPPMFGRVTVHVTRVSGMFHGGTDSIVGRHCVSWGLWHHRGGVMTLQTYSLSEKNELHTLFDNTQIKKTSSHIASKH